MKTLYKQYTIVTIVIILASLAISMFLVTGLYNTIVRKDTNRDTLESLNQVIQTLEHLDENQVNEVLNSSASLGYQLVLLRPDQTATYYGTKFEQTTFSNPMLEVLTKNKTYNGILNYKQNFSIVNHYANDLQNTVGRPFQMNNETYALFMRADNNKSFSDMHYLIVGFLLVTALIIYVTMLLLARQLVKPIKQLQKATKQIASEDYDIHLSIKRKDELGLLAEQFQKMAQHLKENDQLKKDFINNVSHDFQSPLLNIQGYATVLKENDNTEAERNEYLTIIEQETKRLSALTKQLLVLSSLDQKNLPLEKKSIFIDQQLKRLIHAKRWLLNEKQMDVQYELESANIVVDEQLLEQVWDNLIMNAIRYSNEKGTLKVVCKNEKDFVYVAFEDKGIGIPTHLIERVTERFFQVDSARSSESSGLGLSIVKEIVERHNGTLTIESIENKGTKVVVTIPRS